MTSAFAAMRQRQSARCPSKGWSAGLLNMPESYKKAAIRVRWGFLRYADVTQQPSSVSIFPDVVEGARRQLEVVAAVVAAHRAGGAMCSPRASQQLGTPYMFLRGFQAMPVPGSGALLVAAPGAHCSYSKSLNTPRVHHHPDTRYLHPCGIAPLLAQKVQLEPTSMAHRVAVYRVNCFQ